MGLRLNTVAPARGWAWLRMGLRLWLQRPLAFVGLFVFFLFAVLLLMVVLPYIGGPLGMAMLPLLSLGFMVASRSALAGGPVHIGHLVEGLRHPVQSQRRAQWLLCGAYALGTILVITLSDWIDGGTFETLQREMAAAGADGKPSPALEAVLADPRLANGMLVRLGLAGLLSVPFWHAPALVHWGGQGAVQALFSSTVALWRTRGAFSVYLLGWLAVMLVAGGVFVLLSTVTGVRQLLGLMTLPLGLAFSAAFYVSLWFSFDDTFGASAAGNTSPAASDDPAPG